MLTAVKGHVLQEMGQTALVLLLLDGSHALGEEEVHAVFRIVVVADVVGQSAVQLADAHLVIDGDGAHQLRLDGDGAQSHNQ